MDNDPEPMVGAAHVHKGWYSRHYLPHFDQPEFLQFITFRLHDVVPLSVIEDWKTELKWVKTLPATDARQIELHKRIARYEDAHHGACWLRQASIAGMVEETLLHFDGERYRLLAWCIMPNHVHAMIEDRERWTLESILHTWKSYSAQEANRMLGRKGPFWFREYYDRYIRNEQHFCNVIGYIEENPVKAGLVGRAAAWRYGSAGMLAGRDSEKKEAGRDAGAPS